MTLLVVVQLPLFSQTQTVTASKPVSNTTLQGSSANMCSQAPKAPRVQPMFHLLLLHLLLLPWLVRAKVPEGLDRVSAHLPPSYGRGPLHSGFKWLIVDTDTPGDTGASQEQPIGGESDGTATTCANSLPTWKGQAMIINGQNTVLSVSAPRIDMRVRRAHTSSGDPTLRYKTHQRRHSYSRSTADRPISRFMSFRLM
jgi:hypothetical protein